MTQAPAETFAKMKPDVKVQWVEALRSGKFKQTLMVLHRTQTSPIDDRPIGFCCLGVLCEVVGLESFQQRDRTIYIYELGDMSTSLNTDFQMSVSLDDRAHEKLIALNDAGKSFAEIADWIEANL